MLNSTTIPGLKDPLLSPSSLLDSGVSSSLVSRNSSDSLSSFVTARSHVSEEDSQGWGGWISVQVNSFFDRWRAPLSSRYGDLLSGEAITSEDDDSTIEEGPSSRLPLPEWVIPLFNVLKETVGERQSQISDRQQRLFFNPKTGETAWQCVDDVTDGLMEHKPMTSFYE
ncbi:MAG TPA: hypothetical protein DCL40_04990, partial [Coxiellaceae bacterium]|nr:hypothetical protein [Coxiellaceae bacterium]